MLEKYYHILSYILFVIAILLCICMLPMVFAALMNPAMLISLFLFACVIIYSFVSFRFNKITVQAKQPSKSATKAMLNINGAICIFFSVQMLFGAYILFSQPALLREQISSFYTQFAGMNNVKLPPAETIFTTMKVFLAFFCIYAVLLLAHVFMSFALMRKYRNLLSA